MKRFALIAITSLGAIAATLAVAQPQPLPQAGGSDRDNPRQERGDARTETREQRRAERQDRRAEQMTARMNERLAKLRTDMKLKPEQVPLFERVEALVKKGADERRSRWSAMREERETLRHADIMERLDSMSARSGERAQRLKEMADTVRPLWTTLSDEQKTVARRAMREAMAEGRDRMHRMHEHMDGQHMDGRHRDDQRMDDRRGGRDTDGDRGPRRERDEWRDRRG